MAPSTEAGVTRLSEALSLLALLAGSIALDLWYNAHVSMLFEW